jgi:cytidine deaminase
MSDQWKSSQSPELIKKLIEEARRVREFAYAPYSGFQVGAALLAKDGTIFTGCNVEVSNFSATVCAERTAVVKAVSQGMQDFTAVAVIADRPVPVSPCGQCRQTLNQFAPEMEVIMATTQSDEIEIMKLSDLLPRASNKVKLPCQK